MRVTDEIRVDVCCLATFFAVSAGDCAPLTVISVLASIFMLRLFVVMLARCAAVGTMAGPEGGI